MKSCISNIINLITHLCYQSLFSMLICPIISHLFKITGKIHKMYREIFYLIHQIQNALVNLYIKRSRPLGQLSHVKCMQWDSSIEGIMVWPLTNFFQLGNPRRILDIGDWTFKTKNCRRILDIGDWTFKILFIYGTYLAIPQEYFQWFSENVMISFRPHSLSNFCRIFKSLDAYWNYIQSILA